MLTNPEITWLPEQWQQFEVDQLPAYPDTNLLNDAIAKLQTLEPLLSLNDIESFQILLSKVVNKEVFLLQIGDCVEAFSDADETIVDLKLKAYQKVRRVLEKHLSLPVMTIAASPSPALGNAPRSSPNASPIRRPAP